MKTNRLSRFAIPYVIWMAFFVVAPIIMVVIYAFSSADGGATLSNFAKMGTYTVVFTRSFKLYHILSVVRNQSRFFLRFPKEQHIQQIFHLVLLL